MAIIKSKGRLTSEQIQEQLDKSIVKEHSISTELETSFLDYAMSVIVSRALPDARDGFKPVHRRVLYAAYGLGMTSDKPYKKSARLVGEVIGKYHPHGDAAAYSTMVRMAQDFSLRYMLVDGHGNFGSIDGDSPAAMRYTEARLSKISTDILKDIEKDTVDFVDNYDGSEREPTVLPAYFPNFLANGSSGIAVGMATNIPPHNLNELCDAITAVAKNPDITIEELKEYIHGPDFPTAAEIVGEQGIHNYFHTGRGSVTIRSKYHIEELHMGKVAIIITEIPYMVNKQNVIEKIVDLVKAGDITGIADLRDESSRAGIRIMIETKRDVVPEVLLNKLYKSTQLQTNFSVNTLALVGGEPKILNLKECLSIYIKHQIHVLVRKTKFELHKAEERAHILEGLHIAVSNIDEVIKMIRSSKNNEIAHKALMARFSLTTIQAKAILDMRLRNLSALESEKIEQELATLKETIKQLNEILDSHDKQIGIIIDRLDYIKDKYGDERRTEILYGASSSIDDEDLIPVEDIVITMSRRGYLKRLPIDTYRTQRRGGVGLQGLKTHEDDDVEKIVVTSTHTDILMFTDAGKVYRIRGHQVPPGSRQSKGIPAINVINIEKGEKILSILAVDNYDDGFLFFTTINGLVKRSSLADFVSIRQNGKIAITLKENDKLFSVHKTNGTEEIFIGASNGLLVRFEENQARCMGRTASGVKGITLTAKDYVVGTGTSTDGEYVFSIGQKGYGKLTKKEEYRLTKRGAKGVTTLKVIPKTGKLASVKLVDGDEEGLLITSSGKIIRMPIKQVNIIGRSTSGVKIMNVSDNEKIQSVAIFKHDDEGDGEDAEIPNSVEQNDSPTK